MKHACVDLFCGAGGLTNGLLSAGINVVGGVDFEKRCKFPYEFNNKAEFHCMDVRKLTHEHLRTWMGDVDFKILAGCAPCQPFSNMNTNKSTDDKRRTLLGCFYGLIEDLNPDVVIAENVAASQRFPEMQSFVRHLKKLKYHVWAHIVDCALYGLPQRRKRFIILASLHGPLRLFKSNGKSQTLRDAIGHLPPIQAGQTDPDDRMHTCVKFSELNLERIKYCKPGGIPYDLPIHLLPERFKRGGGFSDVFSRMVWNQPSPTICTHFYNISSGRMLHPEQDRTLSLREGSILQGFPNNYEFVPENEPVTIGPVAKMIGNAVPPTLGKVIGEALLNHMKNLE